MNKRCAFSSVDNWVIRQFSFRCSSKAKGVLMNRIAKSLFVLVVASSLLAPLGATPRSPREFKLQAESSKFWDLVDHNAKLGVVGTGFGFTEGPVWDEAGFLYVSDETINKIYRLYPDGKKQEVIALGDPDGNSFDSPNDVIVGPDGALYFTDPTLDLVAGEKQEIPFQGVYRLDAKGNVQLLTKDLTQPNGLAF